MSTGPLIVQETHYDPWGVELSGLGYQYGGIKVNPYLYNGKEFTGHLGVNLHDYGARMYDPAIGRWFVVDAMAELAPNLTPYRYGFNNPIMFTDPTGMFEYSDGYSTQDSRNTTGAVSFSGTYSEGGSGAVWLGMNFSVNGEGQRTSPIYRYLEFGDGSTRNFSAVGFSSRAASFGAGGFGDMGGQGRLGYGPGSEFWRNASNTINGISFVVGGASESLGRTIHARAEVRNMAGWNKTTGGSINNVLIKGVPVSRSVLNGTAQTLKVGGAALGFVGLGMTGYEIYSGKKRFVGEGGLDLIMGGAAFIPGGGWIVSGAYFGGKALLEYTGNNFWNEP